MRNKKVSLLIIILMTSMLVLMITNLSFAYHDIEAMYMKLNEYKSIASDGGWAIISYGPNLKLGDSSDRVFMLRERLIITDDIESDIEVEDPEIFDKTLEAAVKKFQENHGLTIDGIVGVNTLRELNIPIEKRIEQINYNISEMEKYPAHLGREYIIVNIPDFQMKYISNDQIITQQRVIIGRQRNKTPIFNHRISYLVFNPEWSIPFNTVIRDVLPLIQVNPNYFTDNDIRVFRTADGREVNPQSIDWLSINRGNFVYRLQQNPGSRNPMGSVKFIFPNSYYVYLHGTPDIHLFNQEVRTFSLGCIRVEEPIDLAKILLENYSIYNEMDNILEKGITKTVYLKETLPIYIIYWTVWIDEYGEIHFRDDIYNRFQ